MCLKENVFVKIVVLFCVLTILTSCAPKKVRLYGVPDPIRSSGISNPVRSSIVASALALQGKPYRSGAKGPDAFDCSGLVYYVFKQHLVSLFPPAEAQARAGYEVSRDGVLPGDLVFFNIGGDFHIGIIISGDKFIHASKSRGVAMDNVGSIYWHKQLIGYRSVL